MPRIVIIGAGPAGLMFAVSLASSLTPSDNVEVVVLERSAYMYHTDGTPRAYTTASFVPKLFIPRDNAIPKAAASFVKIVRAVAIKISAEPRSEVVYRKIGNDDKEVVGQDVTLVFDYLVIATGSSYCTPIKQPANAYSRAATEAQLKEVREHIEKAQRILVIGGGTVGCEVAGDIAAKFPNKKVTILNASPILLGNNNVPDRFRNKLHDGLKKLNVQLILGERLVTTTEGEERMTGNCFEKRTLVTDRGSRIEADIQLFCGGFRPMAKLVQEMDPSMVDDQGFVKVNPQLQLADSRYGHIFALGDASNNPSPKLTSAAVKQAKFLAGEFVTVLRKKQSAFTTPFPTIEGEMMGISLGPNSGVSHLPIFGGIVLGDFLTSFKARDMLASKFWKALGATMPSSP
ncbi:Pyridine nucleotide-disulfide oxidoreductase [Globisporangium polare]